MDNAISYCVGNSTVSVVLETLENGQGAMVAVIPSELLPRLTERFYRIDKGPPGHGWNRFGPSHCQTHRQSSSELSIKIARHHLHRAIIAAMGVIKQAPPALTG